MKLYIVRATSNDPIGPSSLAFYDEDTASAVKKVLGFRYKIDIVNVGEIPTSVRNLANEWGINIPDHKPAVKTEVDTTLNREYTTLFNRWMYHPQGEGSTSRLVDMENKKTYTIPHDERIREGLTNLVDFLRERL